MILDPENAQEIGLVILLAMVSMLLFRGRAGELEIVVSFVVYVLVFVGISFIIYGFFLKRKMNEQMKRLQ